MTYYYFTKNGTRAAVLRYTVRLQPPHTWFPGALNPPRDFNVVNNSDLLLLDSKGNSDSRSQSKYYYFHRHTLHNILQRLIKLHLNPYQSHGRRNFLDYRDFSSLLLCLPLYGGRHIVFAVLCYFYF